MDEISDFPMIEVDRDGNDLTFYCDYCRRRHIHGAPGGLGHRVAHCHSAAGIAAYPSGYVLVPRRESSAGGALTA
jgi:hypothetical protein